MQSMGTTDAWPRDYICDTWAERPTSGLVVGSRCFAKDTGNWYIATGATTWTQIGGGGGADPWTYARLANDFSTTSGTSVDITGLGFAPAANQRYEFEGQLMLRTSTAAANPRAGLAWASGLTDGVANIEEAQSATASLAAKGNINAALLIAVGGLPNATQSWPCTVWGMAIAGASPTGSIRLQLATETATTTTVTAKAGSFLKWRLIP